MAANAAMPGMLVGGVNQNLEDSAAKAYCKTEPAARCYIDNAESYSTNEITIYWNSPLVYLLAVTEKAEQSGPVDPPAPKVTMKGDANLDETVDVSDAVLVAKFASGDSEAKINDQGKINGDCDGKAGLDDGDVTYILKMIVKLV